MQWVSNDDNSFRVTVNQSLIAALGTSFDDKDVTIPLKSEALSPDHAGPGTECYGCHRYLDPMRNYFFNEFVALNYTQPEVHETAPTAFVFLGESFDGGDLYDFAANVAKHPILAEAWTMKLCNYANSSGCDAQDPEFQRIAAAFKDSGFQLKTLFIELFSSAIVTGTKTLPNHEKFEYLVSISRYEHFCQALSRRLETANICSFVENLSSGLPSDAWSRGATEPNQPASPSLFYSATIESLCVSLSNSLVGGTLNRYSGSDEATSLSAIAKDLIGDENSERYQAVFDAMSRHVKEAESLGISERNRIRSAFTLACSSAYTVGVGL